MGNQQIVECLIDREDKLWIEKEAKKLGLTSSGFFRLLIKLSFDGLSLETRQLAKKRRRAELERLV